MNPLEMDYEKQLALAIALSAEEERQRQLIQMEVERQQRELDERIRKQEQEKVERMEREQRERLEQERIQRELQRKKEEDRLMEQERLRIIELGRMRLEQEKLRLENERQRKEIERLTLIEVDRKREEEEFARQRQEDFRKQELARIESEMRDAKLKVEEKPSKLGQNVNMGNVWKKPKSPNDQKFEDDTRRALAESALLDKQIRESSKVNPEYDNQPVDVPVKNDHIQALQGRKFDARQGQNEPDEMDADLLRAIKESEEIERNRLNDNNQEDFIVNEYEAYDNASFLKPAIIPYVGAQEDNNEFQAQNRRKKDKKLSQLERDLPQPPPFNPNVKNDQLDRDLMLAIEESKKDVIAPRQMTDAEMWQVAAGKPKLRCRRFVGIPGNIGGLVVGAKYKHAIKILSEQKGKCTINFLSSEKMASMYKNEKNIPACIVIEAENNEIADSVEDAVCRRIEHLFIESNPIIQKPNIPQVNIQVANVAGLNQLGPEAFRHIYVDFSNIIIGAKTFSSKGASKDNGVCVDVQKLNTLLCCNKEGTQIVAGSYPPIGSKVWEIWDELDYKIKVCKRDEDNGNKEQLIDEFLHAQILREIFLRQNDRPGHNTLVLASGDGNANFGFSNFVEVSKAAAQNGWRVEIWAWKHCISKNFSKLAEQFSDGRLIVCYLDYFAEDILFRR